MKLDPLENSGNTFDDFLSLKNHLSGEVKFDEKVTEISLVIVGHSNNAS